MLWFCLDHISFGREAKSFISVVCKTYQTNRPPVENVSNLEGTYITETGNWTECRQYVDDR